MWETAIKKTAEELDMTPEEVKKEVNEFFSIIHKMMKKPFKKVLINNLATFTLNQGMVKHAYKKSKYKTRFKNFLENEEE